MDTSFHWNIKRCIDGGKQRADVLFGEFSKVETRINNVQRKLEGNGKEALCNSIIVF